MNSGKSLEMFRWNIILLHTISVCTAKYKSSPRHHISLCSIENCFFSSLSGAIRFAVAKRHRRLRRRFSCGCATTNAIVLMTLPTAPQRSVGTAASGYIISTGALRGAGFPPAPPQKPHLFYQSSHFCKLAPFFPFHTTAIICFCFSFIE